MYINSITLTIKSKKAARVYYSLKMRFIYDVLSLIDEGILMHPIYSFVCRSNLGFMVYLVGVRRKDLQIYEFKSKRFTKYTS